MKAHFALLVVLLSAPAVAAQTGAPHGPLDLALVTERDAKVSDFTSVDDSIRIAAGPGWTRTRGIFGDFDLSLEFKLESAQTDAGVGIRTVNIASEWPRRGYSLRLGSAGARLEARRADLVPAGGGERCPLAPGVWHRLEIEARGRRVSLAIDDMDAGAFDIDSLAGSIVFDARKGTVEFRTIRIVRADDPTVVVVGEERPPTYKCPRIVSEKPTTYQAGAMRRGVDGVVGLVATVLPDGTVGDVRVSRWLDPELEHAALASVRQWRFAPATLDGKIVPSTIEIQLRFSLRF